MKSKLLTRSACLMLIVVVFAGCGSSDAPSTSIAGPANDTQSNLLTKQLSVDSAEKSLVGTWNGKIEVMQAGYDKVMAELGDDEEKKQLFAQYMENAKTTQMKLDLHKDRSMHMAVTMTVRGEAVTQPDDGTWTVAEVDGNKVVVNFVRAADNSSENLDFIVESDDTFIMLGPGGEELREVAKLRFQRLR